MCKYVDELKKVNYSKNKIKQIATKFGLIEKIILDKDGHFKMIGIQE